MLQEHQSRGSFEGNPKIMFVLGLLVGISAMTTLTLALLVGWLISGKGLPFAPAVAGNAAQVAADPSADPYAVPDAPLAGPVKPVDENSENIRGNKNAKVTLIEYSDFECPYCQRHDGTVKQALADYPNDVRVVFRHFPLLSLHPEAQKAAEAVECAGQQGKFWEMHDEIFKANEAGTMSVAKWKEVAKSLKLDSAKFDACLDSGATAAKVAQDAQEGEASGIQGTPGTFVNGQLVEGAVPYATLKAVIDAQLNQ
ncbi:DsbA family protein, partial [Patescibacteria group bacterium]|nr:DsbA family protein [Patescibacteria group bacterium]